MFREIDNELTELSNFVQQEDVGYVRDKEAWARINELLDMRNELGRLPLILEVEVANESL